MKKKLLLSTLLSFAFYLLSSQVPQGFNYQAIARDGSGNPIVGASIKVKLSILTDTLGFRAGTGGVYVWEEEHINVMTNAYGLFTVVLGDPSATWVRGVPTFDAINWNQPKLFIGTKIANPSTYKVLGGAKLWSVPYSMVAGELGGTVDKIKVKGTEVEPDSALFEVRNKNGQIVFAVYNEGVRVYVDDGVKGNTKGGFAIGGFGTDKGTSQNYLMVSRDSIRAYVNDTISKGITKGGFAIGGFGTAKTSPQEYFRVTRDSTRVYVYDDGTKGNTKGGFAIGGFDNFKGLTQELMSVSKDSIRLYIDDTFAKGVTKGGFAIGGFDVGKGDGASFFNVSPDPTGKINPAQNRILWYPLKNAFLTGKIIIEHKDSVGENSFSSGYLSRAKGIYSQALGYQAIARGNYSTAIGRNAVAGSINSFAFGENAKARNGESYAIGRGAIADGFRSFAFGSAGIDSAGQTTGVAYAKGDYSFAIGQGSQALGLGSFAMGIADTAKGQFTVSIGYKSRSSYTGAISIGYKTKAAAYSTSIGYFTESMNYSTALGDNTRAIGIDATSMGYATLASGSFSTAMGQGTIASGYYSTAMGGQTTASADYSTALGCRTSASGLLSTAMGYYSVASSSRSTAMGENTTSSGWASTAMGSYSKATGNYSTAMGSYCTAGGIASTAVGYNTIANGSYSSALGFYSTASCYASVVLGRYNVVSGSTTSWVSTDPLFVIGNGSSTVSSNNAVTVLKNGNVGIGTTAPGTYRFYVNGTAYSTGGWTSSDLRWKKNICPLTGVLRKLLDLNGVNYEWRKSEFPEMNFDSFEQIGLIAQDVERLFPELVRTGEDGYKAVSYEKLSVFLVEGMKEQQQQIESTKQENIQLKSDIQALRDEMEQIKAMLAKVGVK